jgi:hypothetical protein
VPPLHSDLKYVQEWLKEPTLGAEALLGLDHDLWHKTPFNDLATIHVRTQEEATSRFLLEPLLSFWHYRLRPCRHLMQKSLFTCIRGLRTPLIRLKREVVEFGSMYKRDASISASPRNSESSQVTGGKQATDIEAQNERPLDSKPVHIYYPDETILRIAILIGTILASFLPIISIIVMYFIEDLGTRLCVSSIFTMIFSCTLRLVTRARIAELFAATSA